MDESTEISAVPDAFLCPITREVMVNPVINQVGHTYERMAIEEWLTQHNTDPLTRQTLTAKILIPNHMLRSQIQIFLEETIPFEAREDENIDVSDAVLTKFITKHLTEVSQFIQALDALKPHRKKFVQFYQLTEPLRRVENCFRKVFEDDISQWRSIAQNVETMQRTRVEELLDEVAANAKILRDQLDEFFVDTSGYLSRPQLSATDVTMQTYFRGLELVGGAAGGVDGYAMGAALGAPLGPIGSVCGATIGFYLGTGVGAFPASIGRGIWALSKTPDGSSHDSWRMFLGAARQLHTWLAQEKQAVAQVSVFVGCLDLGNEEETVSVCRAVGDMVLEMEAQLPILVAAVDQAEMIDEWVEIDSKEETNSS